MKRFRALFAALVAAQVSYAYLPERRLVAATRGIVGLLLATSARRGGRGAGRARGARARSSRRARSGFATEVAGVATGRPFGRYTYSGKLGVQVAACPCWRARRGR